MSSETGWSLHPDRALPSDPSVRPIAREILATTAGLPIVSHARPRRRRRAGARRAVRRPGAAARHPGPLRHPDAGVPGRAARRLGVARRWTARRRGRPTRARSGAASAPTGTLFRGTPTRFWLEHELVEVFGVDERRRPRPPTSSTTSCPTGSRSRGSGPGRCSSASASRSWRRPTRRAPPWRTTPTSPPTAGAGASCRRSGPTRSCTSTGPAGAPTSPGWRSGRGSTIGGYGDLPRALRAAARARSSAAGARATDHGHLSADTTPLSAAEAARIFAAALRGEVSAADAQAFSGHMLFEMARMSVEDGLVMQLHPGVLRDHDPAVAGAPAARRGLRHPGAPPSTCAALRPAAGGVRPRPAPPPGALHGRRGHVHPRAGAARRRLPGGAARRAVVVPRLPGRHAPLPGGGHRDGRLLQHERVRRRHPRVLLDPGPARPGAPGRRRLPRPAGRRAPARRSTRPIETAVDLAYRIPLQAYAPPRTANAFPTPGVLAAPGDEHSAKEHE